MTNIQIERLLVFSLIAVALFDSFLAEEPFVPTQYQALTFYVLVPIVLVGILALLPFLRRRLLIVRPKITSNLILTIAVGSSAFLIVAWSIIYYQSAFLGTGSISGTALTVKDVLLVGFIGLLAATGIRIMRWYRQVKNKVVFAWGLWFLLTIPFAFVRILPDYFPGLDAATITNMFNGSSLVSYLGTLPPIYSMGFPYYGWKWLKWIIVSAAGDSLVVSLYILTILNVPLDNFTLTILVSSLYYSTIVFVIIYSRLVKAVPNQRAKDYYWGVGYAAGLLGATICAIDAGIPTAYPLPWYAALSISIPTMCLCFATFTSAASYFSISEEVKREIRQDKAFLTSIGEAQTTISTEHEITKFYDRFTGLARKSGAVEASSITRDEIFSYANAIKKLEKPMSAPSPPA